MYYGKWFHGHTHQSRIQNVSMFGILRFHISLHSFSKLCFRKLGLRNENFSEKFLAILYVFTDTNN